MNVIGDVVCDFDSVFNFVLFYDCVIFWSDLVLCVYDVLFLDVMVIDNLLFFLFLESLEDYVV